MQIDTQDLIKDDMINAKKHEEDVHDECPIGSKDSVPAPDIQMLDVYRELAFDNPDGGVWKQGWDIQYDPKHWNSHHKLKVSSCKVRLQCKCVLHLISNCSSLPTGVHRASLAQRPRLD